MTAKSEAIKFINDLVGLSQKTLRQVYYVLNTYMKKLNGNTDHDKAIWEEVATLINDIIKKANKEAGNIAYIKNGEDEKNDYIPLTINGKSPKQRVDSNIDVARETSSRFIKDDNNKKEDVGLGVSFFKSKTAIDIQNQIHKEFIQSGKVNAASSALFLGLVFKNVFGSILYSGRAAEASIWKKQNKITGIEVVTQQDNGVCEQCKALAGVYPPDYIFLGNHPNCRCYTIPIYGTELVLDIPSRATIFWSNPKFKKWYKKTLNYQQNTKYLKI